MTQPQTTVEKEVHCEGIALHSGQTIHMTLKPADENTGIVFKRIDIQDKDNIIKALYNQVVDTRLGTFLANSQGANVGVIEHFMSAMYNSDLDNVLIEVDGGEVPGLDGCAEPYVFLLESAGVQSQNSPRQLIKIIKEFTYTEDDVSIKVEPGEDFTLEETISFDNQYIGTQSYTFSSSRQNYKAEIARARTFGMYNDLEKLKAMGLAKGASLDNAIGINDDGIMNEGGLRYPEEFARHKMLDFMGDMMTAGHRLVGRFTAYKAGHTSHNHFLRALLDEHKECWQLITLD